jgi:hypothetical protein
MQDGTMWILSLTTSPTWTQAPPLPGARVVTNIDYNLGTVYACASDGSIFSGVVQAGFSWQLVATTPP